MGNGLIVFAVCVAIAASLMEDSRGNLSVTVGGSGAVALRDAVSQDQRRIGAGARTSGAVVLAIALDDALRALVPAAPPWLT